MGGCIAYYSSISAQSLVILIVTLQASCPVEVVPLYCLCHRLTYNVDLGTHVPSVIIIFHNYDWSNAAILMHIKGRLLILINCVSVRNRDYS